MAARQTAESRVQGPVVDSGSVPPRQDTTRTTPRRWTAPAAFTQPRRSATCATRDTRNTKSDSGYDAAGIDLLVQRCTGWYARRHQERRIKPGDRVAVLGRGIAVVEQVEGNWIRAVLWNRDRLRIRRNEITWHDGNMRWETSRDTCAVASGKA